MSTLQVANLAFTANDSNQIQYSNSVLTFVVGSANDVFRSNSSVVSLKLSSTSTDVSNTTASQTYTSNLQVGNLTTNGQIIYSGNITPTLLSASTSDWNPGFGNAYFIRVSSNTSLSLYGMVEGVNGQIVVLNNIGNSAIVLANEDSVNENNASRRFQLPNDITLFPFSSISLIYDGASARWKAQNSIGIDNFHKGSLTKGFFNGGSQCAVCAERTTFSSETTALVPGANLIYPRYGLAGVGNAVKGFFSGGFGTNPGAPTLVSERTTFATELSAFVPGANLTANRCYLSGLGNSCKGFIQSSNFTTPAATTDKTTYSTETTASAPTASLVTSITTRCGTGAVANALKGFVVGGSSAPAAVVAACRNSFSTETVAAVTGANLSQGRSFISAAGNNDKGFFSGGSFGVSPTTTVYATTCRTTYSTETTAAVVGANLRSNKCNVMATGNICKGFFTGGANFSTIPVQFFVTADRTTYSTETNAAVPGANLTQAKSGAAI